MSSQNPDTTAVKVESSTENGNTTPQQGGEGNTPNNQEHHGGGRGRGRGGRGFQGGNRRPMNNPRNEGGSDFSGGNRGGNRWGNRGGGGPRGDLGPRNPEDRIYDKISLMSGPTFDLPPFNNTEKKFNGRSRLYIGNISSDVSDEELNDLFKQYGETSELFINKEKNFGFVKLDFQANAEKAKRELDGTPYKSRTLKIRFAPNGSSIKVKNLTPFVSNELLYLAFSVFGEIERAVVIVDDRGKSTGEGIVEFTRKGNASLAIRKCNECCFFLTASLRPVIVEPYDALDDIDGYADKNIPRKNYEFNAAREVGPRFANPNSFEHEYGMRWKHLYELFTQKEQALKKELEMEMEKLEAQMEYARYEHETEMLREQLRSREMDKERQKREWEMKERQVEESRARNEEQLRRQQEEMQNRMIHQEEELRRRQQENNLFMQAHQLDDMLNQQEQDFEQPDRGLFNSKMSPNMMGGGNAGKPPMDSQPFVNEYERGQRFEGRGGRGRGGWSNENHGGGGNHDDFPSKRRRY